MKYLLQAIEARRSSIRLNDTDLRKLLTEVRKGRDEREEFLESIDRILTELRNYSEHSSAFLTKVSKRDAPDYYDVIKHPMDLGTLQKKVKAGQYKSKKQFAHDLDLIWDNCLLYNSDPTHPLRRNVYFMRKKANHLLDFISDKSDVKDALMQWEVNETAGQLDKDSPPTSGQAKPGFGFGNTQLDSSAAVSLDKRGSRFSSARKHHSLDSIPFEQRPAFFRTPDAMTKFQTLDSSLFSADLGSLPPFAEQWIDPSVAPNATAGPSSKPISSAGLVSQSAPVSLLSVKDAVTELAAIKDQTLIDPLSATLEEIFKPVGTKGKQKASPEPYEVIHPIDASADWWTACTSNDLMAAGLPTLHSSERARPPQQELDPHTGRPRKRKRPMHLIPPTRRPGLRGMIAQNIRTIQKIQETHNKFLNLAHVVENEAPIPAYLTQVSSDEESDDYPSADEDDEPPDVWLTRYPLARISSQSAWEHMSWNTKSVLSHHGFEGAHRATVDVLTNVMAEFLMNMGRTLRIYSDRYAQKMSAEEIILHSLFESGNTDIPGLESYIRDDVERYGGKMNDLLRKLRQSYKDQLGSTDRGIIEDEALFADGAEALVSGNFAEDLGDDFFGFRELGIDREFGLSGLTVPGRLFHGRGHARAATAARGVEKEEILPYPPPSPYIPLTTASISVQIGLLRSWYHEKIREHRNHSKPSDSEDPEIWANTLPDMEQEKQRYKVPPNGKMPKRTLWTPILAQQEIDAAAAASSQLKNAESLEKSESSNHSTNSKSIAKNASFTNPKRKRIESIAS